MKFFPLTLLFSAFGLLLLAGCSAGPVTAEPPHEPPSWSSGGSLSELQQAFDISFYDISVAVFPDEQRISGEVTAHVYAISAAVDRLEFDLVRNYDVAHVSVKGTPVTFEHEDDKLLVDLGAELRIEEDAITPVTIRYSGAPPVAVRPPWEGGFTWSEDMKRRHWVGLSCQLEGAKVWLPVKDHPVSRADSVQLAVDVPKPYMVAANGLHKQTSASPLSENRHVWHWKTRYPIHNYNINFTMGMFKVHEKRYRTSGGRDMPVLFYVLEEDAHQAGALLEMTVRKLEQLRHYFGEYGFVDEKFGLVHTPYLGMEHQTINAYGNDFDYTTIDGRSYDWLLLHEMGHEWWGNLITVEDWAEFWIHEGITTFTDVLFLYDFYSPEVYYDKIEEYVGKIRNHQPIIPGEDINSAQVYNHDVYYKGAYFMHTLMHLMGRPVFLEAIRSFAEDNRFAYTSTEAFIEHFQGFTSYELRPLFDLYLYDVRLPEFSITAAQEAGEDGTMTYSIRLENADELQQAHGSGLSFPVEIRTSEGLMRYTLGAAPVVIESQTEPVFDPRKWYLHADMDFLE